MGRSNSDEIKKNMDLFEKFLFIFTIAMIGVCIYTFTPSGKRWTGETDD
ncbi:hypothetical protein Barb6_02721 [Bacteroidales bacterium Barb6]|nr:hypothetical protein Barb6_02721 [Bacteroidales bacterium Barb6]